MVSALALQIPDIIIQLNTHSYIFVEVVGGVQLVG